MKHYPIPINGLNLKTFRDSLSLCLKQSFCFNFSITEKQLSKFILVVEGLALSDLLFFYDLSHKQYLQNKSSDLEEANFSVSKFRYKLDSLLYSNQRFFTKHDYTSLQYYLTNLPEQNLINFYSIMLKKDNLLLNLKYD